MKSGKLTRVALLAIIIGSFSFTGCSQQAKEKSEMPVDLSALKSEIEKRQQEFEKFVADGDSIALGDIYTSDAVIMPYTAGREGVISSYGNMIRNDITGVDFETTGLWGSEQILVEEGTGVWYRLNGMEAGRGKYLFVWKKEEGEWKIFRDTWYSDPN